MSSAASRRPSAPRRARARDSEDELLPAEEAYRQLIDLAAGAVLVVHGAESLRFLREELSGGGPSPARWRTWSRSRASGCRTSPRTACPS